MSQKKPPESRRSITQEFRGEEVRSPLDGHSVVTVVERWGRTNAIWLNRWKRDQLRNSGSGACPDPGGL